MTKQQEAAIASAKIHEEQDISHKQTVRNDMELMRMIEEARKGLSCRKENTDRVTAP